MYHYYHTTKRVIKSFPEALVEGYFPAYQPLTAEQSAFYEAHPNASVIEVLRCEIFVPDPIPEPTLEEARASAKKTLSDLSLATLDKFAHVYQVANAQASLFVLAKDPTAATVYDAKHASDVMTVYNAVGKDLRDMYKEAETDIDAAATVAAVATLESTYIQRYEDYEYNSEEA